MNALNELLRSHRYPMLLLQLAVLLLVLLEGPHSLLGRTLWLGHVGLFLLWQPFVAGESRLSFVQAGMTLIVVLLVSTTLGWGWLAAWLALLSAVVGGKVVMARERRYGVFYLLVFGFLLFVLLVWVAPQIVGGTGVIPELWVNLIAVALWTGAALVVPRRGGSEVGEIYDFVASLLLLLLLAVLLLGTTSLMALARVGYFDALLRTLFGLAALLLLLSWAWNPRPGFGGFGVFVSTYLMRLGFPFDAWLKRVVALAETVEQPDDFLAAAIETFSALPWVTGGAWFRSEQAEGRFGVEARHETLFVYGGINLRLFTGYAWTAALIWQGSLLLKLVVELHRAKVHERAARQMRFMQSVHETGARLTHDVKNLLQSLDSLCYAAERAARDAGSAEGRGFVEMMRRQLPAVAGRLRGTLDRLNSPQVSDAETVAADVWWQALSRRFERDGVVFEPRRLDADLADARLPSAVFDTVAENLIANALGKRREEPGLRIRVRFAPVMTVPTLRVEDSGAPIDEAVATHLFREPVESRSGLGIGLFQAARLASLSGWRLRLAENRTGTVAFELARATLSGPEADAPSSGPCP